MSLRDLFVVGTVLGMLPVCLARPWVGVLVFSWISYMNPHKYAWGFARGFPVAMVVAIVTLVGLLLTTDRSRLPRDAKTYIMLMMPVLFTLTTILAFNQWQAWDQWEKVMKIFIMTFVTMILINDPRKLRYLLLVIALSIGLIGLKGAIFTVLSGGQHRVYGPASSFMADNNDLALALNMVLPLLMYLPKDEPRRWLRLALYACLVGSAISIIFTFSRGGFLALAALGALTLVKARRKAIAAMLLAAAVVIAVVVVPEQWTTRMQTIETYRADNSALGRLNAWATAWNVAVDRPLIGGGFELWIPPVFAVYSPEPWNVRDVHSIYFEMLGEQGFFGFALFMALIGLSLLSLRRLRRRCAGDPTLAWARHYPDMLSLSIAGYLVGGAFLGRAYFDLFYHLIAAVILVGAFAQQAAAALPASPPPDTLPARRTVRARTVAT